MIYIIVKVEQTTTSTGKAMYKSTLKDSSGKEETINLFDEVKVGQELDGEIYTNDKGYRNFKSTARVAKANFMDNKKTETFEKLQDRKAGQIEKAQDRSAWMWAKNNASTLLAAHPGFQTMKPQDVATQVIELATKIYNGEPTEPFSSPKTHYTSPTEQFPQGIDMYNHPLTTDAERAAMDDEAMQGIEF